MRLHTLRYTLNIQIVSPNQVRFLENLRGFKLAVNLKGDAVAVSVRDGQLGLSKAANQTATLSMNILRAIETARSFCFSVAATTDYVLLLNAVCKVIVWDDKWGRRLRYGQCSSEYVIAPPHY